MKSLILFSVLMGTLAFAEPGDRRPPGDHENIPYACLCACYDWQISSIRVRLPGGGYGYEQGHLPLLNPARGNYAEFAVTGMNDARQCRAIRGWNCAGVRSEDLKAPGGPRYSPGFLGGCRYTVDSFAP